MERKKNQSRLPASCCVLADSLCCAQKKEKSGSWPQLFSTWNLVSCITHPSRKQKKMELVRQEHWPVGCRVVVKRIPDNRMIQGISRVWRSGNQWPSSLHSEERRAAWCRSKPYRRAGGVRLPGPWTPSMLPVSSATRALMRATRDSIAKIRRQLLTIFSWIRVTTYSPLRSYHPRHPSSC